MRRDLPGQLANRILQAIIREATAIVDSGLASAEDVDTAVKMGMGLRFPAWGPLEHVDTVGLELCLSVQNNVLPSLYNGTQATRCSLACSPKATRASRPAKDLRLAKSQPQRSRRRA